MKKTVVLDLSNILYRSFFGIRHPLTTPDGTPSNALYGLFNSIHKVVKKFNPDVVVAALDSRSSHRRESFKDYKNNRAKMPPDLARQIPLVYEMLDVLGISKIQVEGLEADDVIGSIAKKQEGEIYLITGDKDLLQLVNERVFVYDAMKEVLYTIEKVQEKYGLFPNQIVDYLALIGDSSDNIPGVKGIGEKSAVKLLQEYKTFKGIYENIDKIKGASQKKLLDGKEVGEMSYMLATLQDLEIDLNLLKEMSFSKEEAVNTFKKWNMKSAIEKISTWEKLK